MTAEQICFEGLKLVAQFAGAMFIAWKAVHWALGRYKSEKLWERRLTAYSDLLSSLARMDQILGVWELQAMNVPTNLTEDEEREVQKRYYEARRNLEEAWGIAQILLPEDIAKLLATISTEIDNARQKSNTWMDAIGEEWSILVKARLAIIDAGKRDLQPDATPPLFRNAIRSASKA